MDLATLDRSIEDIGLMVGIVRAAPPERFRMDDYVQETRCGTAACVAGWCFLNDGFRARCELTLMHDPDEVAEHAIPALHGLEGFGPDSPEADYFLYGGDAGLRSSFNEDAHFAATPAEVAALGEDYARGLNEREAALNRLAIVRACLVKWRVALTASVPQPTRECVGV